MRYLKLYEAFKSKGISNTLKFLKEKVGSSSATEFKNSLVNFMKLMDFPIDKLSDDDIKYMNSKKALQLKSEDKVTNSKGIWVIKYWFSLDKGYLGYTATGNETKDVSSPSDGGLRTQKQFTDPELEYIKSNITRTGEIWPVDNYTKLESGDVVIGLFNGSPNKAYIGLAKIFIDDNKSVFAIQDVNSGSSCDNEDWRDYTEYGDKSWWLSNNDDLGTDHSRLHYWRPSEEEIHYIEPPVEKVEDEDELEVDPLTWNLPLSSRFDFSSWSSGYTITKKSIKEADFALILYFDELINKESLEKPSETKKQRVESKEGATKLMTDQQIKKMNIERYIKKLIVSLNITETEFFNLEKIVSKHLSQEFSYISIYNKRPDWEGLGDFTNYLYQVVDSDDKEYYLYGITYVVTQISFVLT